MHLLYCENCKKNYIRKIKNCRKCGHELVESKNSITIVSIICVAISILIALAFIFAGIYCIVQDSIIASSGDYSDGYGWAFLFVLGGAFFVIPYYLILSIATITSDFNMEKGKARVVKDIIILFLSIIAPITVIGLLYYAGSHPELEDSSIFMDGRFDIIMNVVKVLFYVIIAGVVIKAIVDNKKKKTITPNNITENKLETSKDNENSNFIYCSKCGKKVSKDVKFCPECGNKF